MVGLVSNFVDQRHVVRMWRRSGVTWRYIRRSVLRKAMNRDVSVSAAGVKKGRVENEICDWGHDGARTR